MRTIPREVSRCGDRDDPVETTRRLLIKAKKSELEAYLQGALHDAIETIGVSSLAVSRTENS